MPGVNRRIPRTEDARERDRWRVGQDDDNFLKANKVIGGTEDNIVTLTEDGDIQDSGLSFDDVKLKKANTVTVSSDYTVLEINEIIWVDASSGPVVITLFPSITIQGQEFIIEKIDSTFNTVTVAGDAETVNGDPSFDLLLQYESVQPRSTGAGYII